MNVFKLVPLNFATMLTKSRKITPIHDMRAKKHNEHEYTYSTSSIKRVLVEEVEDVKWVMKQLDVCIIKK